MTKPTFEQKLAVAKALMDRFALTCAEQDRTLPPIPLDETITDALKALNANKETP